MDVIQNLCRHCYGIDGDFKLQYQNKDGAKVGFESSEQLLSALLDDGKVSGQGELLVKSCLKLAVLGLQNKKTRPATAPTSNDGASPTAAVPEVDDGDQPYHDLMAGDTDFDFFNNGGDETMEFLYVAHHIISSIAKYCLIVWCS